MSGQKKNPLVVGIGFSPRKDGNSDTLLRWALAGAREAGARTKSLFVRDFKVNPCKNCGGCEDTGECSQHDDFMELASELEAADAAIIATPVYFMSVPAQGKAFIDRHQYFWARKYVFGIRPVRENRPALLLMTAGSDRPDIFACAKSPVSSMLITAGFRLKLIEPVAGVDEKGAVKKIPGLERKIQNAGKKLVRLAGENARS